MRLRSQLDAVMVSQRSTTQPGNFDWGKRIVISGALVVDTAGHQMENSLEQQVEVTLTRASLMDQLLRHVVSHAFGMTLPGCASTWPHPSTSLSAGGLYPAGGASRHTDQEHSVTASVAAEMKALRVVVGSGGSIPGSMGPGRAREQRRVEKARTRLSLTST